ncbi:MAG: polysaccharide lyase family 1 protein [Armatimonadota bacterium]
MQKTGLAAAAAGALLVLVSPAGGQERLPAFPGAEGFGAGTPGGRGGKVIKVTTLKPSGPGSLNAACQTPGPRIVVFEVSGVIRGDIVITEPYITIAGQTAPGAGITIQGLLRSDLRDWHKKTDERPHVHDVVVRFLRVRGVPGRGDVGDCIQFSSVQNAVLDHLSLSWSEDEVIDLWARATDITIQWCTIEESSAKKGEPWHKFGLIAGGRSYRISIHHNLFAHHVIRSPCLGSGPADFRNNVVYHFEQGFVHHNNYIGRPGFNFVGNYYKRGNRPWCEFRRDGRYYLRDNVVGGKLIRGNPGLPGVVDEPTPVPPVTTHSPHAAYRLVLARAGCFPRDAVTRRTIKEVRTGTGSYGRHAPKNLMQGLRPGRPPKDTDDDGMPDAWEDRHGLDRHRDDSARPMPSGYTAIEQYVNGLAERLLPGSP